LDYLLFDNEVICVKLSLIQVNGTRLLHTLRLGRNPKTNMWLKTTCICNRCCGEYPSPCEWTSTNPQPDREGKKQARQELDSEWKTCLLCIWFSYICKLQPHLLRPRRWKRRQ
ncbi:hypothetical protein LSAT2_030833, partial [Lamellibrachia satsuma]